MAQTSGKPMANTMDSYIEEQCQETRKLIMENTRNEKKRKEETFKFIPGVCLLCYLDGYSVFVTES